MGGFNQLGFTLPETEQYLRENNPTFAKEMSPQERMQYLDEVHYGAPATEGMPPEEMRKPSVFSPEVSGRILGPVIPIAERMISGAGGFLKSQVPKSLGEAAEMVVAPPFSPPGMGVQGYRTLRDVKERGLMPALKSRVESAVPFPVGKVAREVGAGNWPEALGTSLAAGGELLAAGKLVGRAGLIRAKVPLDPDLAYEAIGRAAGKHIGEVQKAMHQKVGEYAENFINAVDDPRANPVPAIDARPHFKVVKDAIDKYFATYTDVGAKMSKDTRLLLEQSITSPGRRWTARQAKDVRSALETMREKAETLQAKAALSEGIKSLTTALRDAAKTRGVEADFDAYNDLHYKERRMGEALFDKVAEATKGGDVLGALKEQPNISYLKSMAPGLKAYGLDAEGLIEAVDAYRPSVNPKLQRSLLEHWGGRHLGGAIARAAGLPWIGGYLGAGMTQDTMAAGRKAPLPATNPLFREGQGLIGESLPAPPRPVTTPTEIPPPPAPPVLPIGRPLGVPPEPGAVTPPQIGPPPLRPSAVAGIEEVVPPSPVTLPGAVIPNAPGPEGAPPPTPRPATWEPPTLPHAEFVGGLTRIGHAEWAAKVLKTPLKFGQAQRSRAGQIAKDVLGIEPTADNILEIRSALVDFIEGKKPTPGLLPAMPQIAPPPGVVAENAIGPQGVATQRPLPRPEAGARVEGVGGTPLTRPLGLPANALEGQISPEVGAMVPKVEAGTAGKEPWEMTREQYLNKQDEFPELPGRTKMLISGGMANFDKIVGEYHEKFVKQAVDAGKPIPPEVLKDYPDLKRPPEVKARQLQVKGKAK